MIVNGTCTTLKERMFHGGSIGLSQIWSGQNTMIRGWDYSKKRNNIYLAYWKDGNIINRKEFDGR